MYLVQMCRSLLLVYNHFKFDAGTYGALWTLQALTSFSTRKILILWPFREPVFLLMQQMSDKRTIIFVSSKTTANALCHWLESNGQDATTIMQAKHKSNVWQAWIGSRTSIPNCLIATDVISRGTHQIGCMGHAGKTDVTTTSQLFKTLVRSTFLKRR